MASSVSSRGCSLLQAGRAEPGVPDSQGCRRSQQEPGWRPGRDHVHLSRTGVESTDAQTVSTADQASLGLTFQRSRNVEAKIHQGKK